MNVVEKFNGLNGAVVTRKETKVLLHQADMQEQTELAQRLATVLKNNPKEKSFIFKISDPAIERVPVSVLPCLCLDEINEDNGLNGVSQQDLYNMVTDLMLNTIKEVGYLPWQKGWTGTGDVTARNYVTRKPYSGINALILAYDYEVINGKRCLVHPDGKDRYFLTFKQIEKQGARLKKGSKGREVMYYNFVLNYKDESREFSTTDADKFGKWAKANGITKEQIAAHLKRIPILKYYKVFSAKDCEGLKELPPIEEKVKPIEAAQAVIDLYPNKPKYVFGSEKASYSPGSDYVSMPKINAFKKEADYYSVFFHELIHSTGHQSRLNRDMNGFFGNDDYAFEELIAELGAVFLCAQTGILFQTRDNSAKYLRGWNKKLVGKLSDDNRFFLKAAAAAQKGANYILDLDADDVPAYLREAVKEVKKAEKEKPAKKVVKKTVKKPEIVGYAILDNIGGNIVASKATLAELEKAYHSLGINKSFEDMPVLVYEIIKKGGKNKLGEAVKVNWKQEVKTPSPKVTRKRKKQDPQQLALGLKGKRKPVKKQGLKSPAPAEAAPAPVIVPVAVEPTPVPEVKPVPVKKKNPLVQGINESDNSNPEFYTVTGEVGRFLQQVERKPVQSVVITLDGEQGAGKTTTLYKFMDAFAAPGNSCLFISGEEHPQSSLAKDKVGKYLSPAAQQNIDTVAEVADVEQLYGLIADYEVIFIDSWQKLQRMVGNIRLDEDLRKRFHGKVFVIIFQQTTAGRTKGGAEVVFDGDIIIKMVKEDSFADNYAYFDKNRYTLVPIETIRYNIASGTCYDPTASDEEPEPAAPLNAPVMPMQPAYGTAPVVQLQFEEV